MSLAGIMAGEGGDTDSGDFAQYHLRLARRQTCLVVS